MVVNKILALSPHTDDVELGCFGALSSTFNMATKVVVSLTLAQNSSLEEFDLAVSHIPWAKTEYAGFNVRTLPQHRQEVLDYFLTLEKQLGPFDLVFCPSSFDSHQDHEVVRQEAFRAFKHTTILGYELPWNNREFRADLFCTFDEATILKKVDCLNSYTSQNDKVFMQKDYIKHLAKVRGVQVDKPYAEAFEVIRCVL